MKRALFSEIHRAFISPLFLVGMGVAFAGLLFSGAVDLSAGELSNMDALAVFRFAYCFNNSFWFVVVGAAIPFAGSFCEDYRSGELRFWLARESRWQYLLSKFVACIVSGGAVVVIACGLFFGLCVCLRPEVVSLEMGEWRSLVGYEPFVELLLGGNVVLYWVLFCCAQFCYGAFWAAFGFTVSLFALYRYAAYAAPFIGSIAFVQIVHLGFWPPQLNLATLAQVQNFGDPLQTLAVIAGMYGGLCLLMLAVCHGRFKAVTNRA